MKKVWREIVIELTAEEEAVWDRALSERWVQITAGEYFDCPISPSVKGKAALPFDPELIVQMISELRRLDNVEERIRNEISRKLAHSYSDERMI